MTGAMIASFVGGLFVAGLVGSVARILFGMRLHLYLVSPDSAVKDQNLIPITADLKKTSLFTTLLRGRWRENIDLSLSDYAGTGHSFRIGYHLWYRYRLGHLDGGAGAKLDGQPLGPGKLYPLRTGMVLTLGDRAFNVLVSPAHVNQELHKDLMGSVSDLDI